MAGRMVEFPSNGSTATGYLSVPGAGPGPGLVVIQEWWGLSDQIKRTADRLAEAGFAALVPDLYHGRVIGFHEPDEAGKAAMALDEGRAAKELRGAVDYLLSSGEASGDYVGTVGFCMGGGLAISLAASHDKVRAVVCFYGVPGPDTDLSKIAGSVLGHFGDHDDYASPEAVRKLAEGLTAAQVAHTFHTYPGAQHAFANEDRPEVHDAEATELAWSRTLEFLRQTL
ncbi:MAG TPA: dienelactone hydrolase family protein [Candidatus Dormibacteraeota bacterium]|nr:dienelactone hydrolase family protein [Candidatus Dormibacteraeota bacterium]